MIYSISKPPPLPGNQGLQIPTLCCSVLKSHLIYINPVVVERGLLKITFHFYGSEAISGTEDKRPNSIITKDAPIALPDQEIPRLSEL